MRAADLFCCGGGAAAGLLAAGFEVVGVDIDPRPEYPGPTIRADVLGLDPAWLAEFDLVWASPPCQAASSTRNLYDPERLLDLPELIEPTRELLVVAGRPYVIENVPGAGQRPDVLLCGSMFGLPIIRHREFELGGWEATQPAHLERCRGREGLVTVAGSGRGLTVGETAALLGVRHVRTRWALNQVVPPAYAAWLGAQWRVWWAWWLASSRRRDWSPAGGVASSSCCDASPSSRVTSAGAGLASLVDEVGSPDVGLALRCAGPRCGALLFRPGPEGGRPSLYCSKRCRQAAWRARRPDNPGSL